MERSNLAQLLQVLEIDFLEKEVLLKNIENGQEILSSKYFEDIVRNFEVEAINLLSKEPSNQIINQIKVILIKTDDAQKYMDSWYPKLQDKFNQTKKNVSYEEYPVCQYITIMDIFKYRIEALKSLNHRLTSILELFDKNESTPSFKQDKDRLLVNDKLKSIDSKLAKYDDLMSIKDVCAILGVQRNAVYIYEKEGYFKRSSSKGKKVLFSKNEIRNYLIA